jgi:queuine tRNA-ribosyltransferase
VGKAPEEGGALNFELVYQSKRSRARVGRIHTPHGIVDTPGFVSVGTNGSLKAVDHRAGDDAGCQLQFSNTYHLLLQPGPELISKAGGLHKFTGRDRPIITDSGGFQVFSLNSSSDSVDEINMKMRASDKKGRRPNSVLKIQEEGVTFKSYVDGRRIHLTPESSVLAQKAFASDICIPLDVLHPYNVTAEQLKQSVFMTHRWEARSLKQHLSDVQQQAMYCVLHGGVDKAMRAHSAEYLTSLPFDGLAVGGSLGKDRDEMMSVLADLMPLLPQEKPVHLLGIADVLSIARSVPLGIDTFDSCYPTRMARHGQVYVHVQPGSAAAMTASASGTGAGPDDPSSTGLTGMVAASAVADPSLQLVVGRLDMRKAKHRDDFTPLQEDCQCHTVSVLGDAPCLSVPHMVLFRLTVVYPSFLFFLCTRRFVSQCRNYSKAYLRHLLKAHEPTAHTLLSIHNLHFMNEHMRLWRALILEGLV